MITMRMRQIFAYSEQHGIRQAARVFCINPSTIYQIRWRYNKLMKTEPKLIKEPMFEDVGVAV